MLKTALTPFLPPFAGLWLVVLAFFAFCFLAHPNSQILRGNLPDPDDYLHLVQVQDFLNGQSWFDTAQHRMNPPRGVGIHFSRIAEIPLTLFIAALKPFMNVMGASFIAAAFLPLMLFAGMLFALRWLAVPFTGERWSGITAFLALFSLPLTYIYMPGHIDHHGLVMIVTTLALGCAARMVLDPPHKRWATGAGVFIALAMAMAMETLPWLLALAALLGVWSTVKGFHAARAGLRFGLSLFVSSAVLLIIAKAPTLLESNLLLFSLPYVLMCLLIAVCFASVRMVSEKSLRIRATVGAALGLITCAGFVLAFPTLLEGPYGAMNKPLMHLMFRGLAEFLPLASGGDLVIVINLGMPIIGAAAGAYLFHSTRGNQRWLWGGVLILLAAALLFTLFYQIRFMRLAYLFAILPLATILPIAFAWMDGRFKGPRRALAKAALIILIAPFPAVIFPALALDVPPLYAALFPVQTKPSLCEMTELEKLLMTPRYRQHPQKIMNAMSEGPEILFRTPHAVMAAPYPTNVDGNFESLRFFATPDPKEAKKIAARNGIGLVALCRLVPTMYLGTGNSFAQQLMTKKPPAWLKPVTPKGLDNYLVFETKR